MISSKHTHIRTSAIWEPPVYGSVNSISKKIQAEPGKRADKGNQKCDRNSLSLPYEEKLSVWGPLDVCGVMLRGPHIPVFPTHPSPSPHVYKRTKRKAGTSPISFSKRAVKGCKVEERGARELSAETLTEVYYIILYLAHRPLVAMCLPYMIYDKIQ